MITTFHLPTKIIFGTGSLARLGVEARGVGRKAILVTGSSSMRKAGVVDRVVQDLKANGVDTLIFDKVKPNPRASTVDEGAKMVREEGVDLVIGLGGGSAMDAAKGITLASAGTEPIWHYVEAEVKITGRVPSLVLVPTVAASGSEANNGAVITNWETHEKRVLISPYLFAKVSIVDPELTLTLPEKPTRQGGVDIFCHLVEYYLTTKRPSPLTEGIMETSMRLVVESLPQVLTRLDDIEARTRLSWVSTIACSQLVRLGDGAGALTLHGIEHPLSGYYDIAHGDGLAALLPAWMRYTLPVKQERFYSLGRNVFGEVDGKMATEKWLEKVGMKLRLRNLGIEPERIEEMANCAVRTAPWLKDHPRLLDAAATAQIYHDSY
ncbi:MAG: iron-containing alcohol dehydrogenase [Dehalococcoidales bacterium]|nr:iron-containing alcohol dehydrogenase [Dehalococcoidales bacterium]